MPVGYSATQSPSEWSRSASSRSSPSEAMIVRTPSANDQSNTPVQP